MARIRTIKPEFPQSQSMGKVSREARLTFILLWTLADDSGRLRGNSRMLASLLFPYDDDAAKKISGWLAELASQNCIICYQYEESDYVQICKWLDHQKIDKPTQSKIPPFESIRESSPNPRESSLLDQGPRTKEGTKDQGEERTKETEQPPAASGESKKPSEVVIPAELNREPFLTEWARWIDYRKAERHTVKPKALEGQLEALLPLGAEEAARCIRDSRQKTYQGIFPERYGKGKQQTQLLNPANYDPDAAQKDSTFGKF